MSDGGAAIRCSCFVQDVGYLCPDNALRPPVAVLEFHRWKAGEVPLVLLRLNEALDAELRFRKIAVFPALPDMPARLSGGSSCC